MQQQSSNTTRRSVWLMAIVIILGVYQILFAYRVLIDNGAMINSLALSPILQAMMAFSWVIICGMVVWRLWSKYKHAQTYTAYLLIGFAISRLLQAAMFVQADYNRNRLGFLVVITLMILTVLMVARLLQQRQNSTHK
ncbi:MAG: hypothetical protein WBC91_11265 [Phototrophicaceae bacterium]